MGMVTAIDYLLLPIYVVLLSLLANWYNKRFNQNSIYSKYFIAGFRIKIFFCIGFALFSAYLLPGDTEMYFSAGIDFKKIVLSSGNNLHFITGPAREFGEYYEANNFRPENYGYINAESNLLAIKFVALFSLISFNCYLIISLFFGIVSFFGLWSMFKVFHKLYPLHHKAIFFCFFLLPSVLFWGSGILKDTLCLGFLGIGFYNLYLFFFEKKFKLRIVLAFLFSFYCLYTIKSYIAMAFLPAFFFWLLIKYVAIQKNIFVKGLVIAVPMLLLMGYLTFGNIDEVIADNAMDTIGETMVGNQQSYIRTTPDDGALIDYGEISPTFKGIVSFMPKALVAVLFRPFLWEARKLTSLIAALEGTFLFVLTIFVFVKRGIFNTFRIIFYDTNILFCFVFAIVFAIAIGMNCFNFGTLVRYKIPCLPFYTLTFILVLKKEGFGKTAKNKHAVMPTVTA